MGRELFLCSFTLCLFIFTLFSELVEGQVLFTFGDSLVDNGNNNYLVNTIAKGNFPPYGVDFPAGPTGRFTNGRNPSDVLARHLGIPYFPPAFLNPIATGDFILHGVNYASAGVGILDTTWGSYVIPLSKQIINFVNMTVSELGSIINETGQLSSFLSDAIFMMVSGADNYTYTCFQSVSKPCDLVELTTILIGNYSLHYRLYAAGARKFALYNLLQNGCNPSRKSNNGECVKLYNDAAISFNDNLNASLQEFEKEMPRAVFVYVNAYDIISQVIDEPASFDRSIYLYYDWVHPTQKVYDFLSTRAYLSEFHSKVHPMNLKQLTSITLNSSVGDYLAYKSGVMDGYMYERDAI